MKNYLIWHVMFITVVGFSSCRKIEPPIDKSFDNMAVMESFGWSTTKNIQAEIVSAESQVISITCENGNIRYHIGYYNQLSDKYTTSFSVPAYVETLKVNGKTATIQGNKLSVNLSNTANYKHTGVLNTTQSGLVSWWKFNENQGSVASDNQGGNHGNIHHAAWQKGIHQSGLKFNGQNSFVELANSNDLNINGDAMSVSLWFSWDMNQQGGFIYHLTKYVLRINAQGRITFAVYTPTWKEAVTSWADRIIDNEWHHLAATYDGTEIKIYIDGVLKATSPASGNLNHRIATVQIGSQASINYFSGTLDEVMLYNRALSATEVTQLMQATHQPGNGEEFLISHWKLNEGTGTAISDSKGTNHGVATDVGWTTGVSGGAASFNGSSSNIRIPNHNSLNPTQEITLMAWVNTAEAKTAKIAQKGDWDGHGIYLDKWTGWSGGIRFANNTGLSVNWGNGIPQMNHWYHLAMTYDGAALRLFVNGQLKEEKAGSGALHSNSRPFAIGSDNAVQKFFNGSIDEVLIFGKALSSQEIQSNIQQSPAEGDRDGDGIPDDKDEFPNDPSRAFKNYFPADGYYSLAFEDLWPGKGDYDFNDLVTDYRFTMVTNAANKLTEVYASFVVRANGAGLENGFGFQLATDILPQDLTAEGSRLSENYIVLDDNGLESGQNKPTFIVFDNIKNILQSQGGFGANVIPNAPYVHPDTIHIMLAVKPNTYDITALKIEHFNPFLIVNKSRGHEIHLPDYAPTALANLSLFGTGDDDSNPSTGRFYKTKNNLPWAINIASSFDYTIESSQINAGHLKFIDWAESGGGLYNDWFLNKSGYRNPQFIYSKPK